MTPATQAKATRLLAQTRVTPTGTAAIYTVQGDHSQYRVVLHHDFELCTCPAGQRPTPCSHRIAARLLYDALERELDQAARARAHQSAGEGIASEPRPSARAPRLANGSLPLAAAPSPAEPPATPTFLLDHLRTENERLRAAMLAAVRELHPEKRAAQILDSALGRPVVTDPRHYGPDDSVSVDGARVHEHNRNAR